MKCEQCGNDYDGRLKVCPGCDPSSEVSSEVTGLPLDAPEPGLPDEPLWHSWGQTSGGIEIVPGWVYNRRVLYNIGDALPIEALMLMQDAFQRKCENRRPLMGDVDFDK